MDKILMGCYYIILNLLESCLCQLKNQDGRCFKNVLSTFKKSKRTALHIAARHGNYECISILVEHGSNIEQRVW